MIVHTNTNYALIKDTSKTTPDTDANLMIKLSFFARCQNQENSLSPTNAGSIFVPSSRAYAGITSDQTSQYFLVAPPQTFNFGSPQLQGTNLNLGWFGINGVTYQPQCSTNLVNWFPYGSAIIGTNGPVMLTLPFNAPQMFFRLSVSN